MKFSIQIVLYTSVMVLIRAEENGNIILGTVSGGSASNSQLATRSNYYQNVNGIEESYESYVTLEQKPDGTCIKRIIEIKNQVKDEREEPIDCDVARQIIKENQEKTEREIRERQEEMRRHHDKMMKSFFDSHRKFEDQLRNMHSGFMHF